MKEVNVFTNGDSRRLSTWSNVPYFFTETLLSKGVKVNRVDLSPSLPLQDLFYRDFHQPVSQDSTFDYFRSNTHFEDVRHRIKVAVDRFPHSEANIFLTFSFSSVGLSDKPSVQFCDWTYDHFFKYKLGRKPDALEEECIKREDSQIEGSDLVISLFPSVTEHMKKRYKNENICYLGNVINSVYDVSEDQALENKEQSIHILFVGSRKYYQGAHALLHGFHLAKQRLPNLRLHIIGMNATDFKGLPKDTYCYGYLDKGNASQREIYYKLLRHAKLFVNTTPRWGAFSASIEAMYHYIPVIVSPYSDFVKTFGTRIDFGDYCKENTPESIEESILKLFTDNEYRSLCINAHNAVKEYTWSNYMDKVIQKVEPLLGPVGG